MKINKTAPLAGKSITTIDAPVSVVWKLVSDIDTWPTWQVDVSEAQLEGKLEKGSIFHWKAMGMKITSELQLVKPLSSIGWTGKSRGMQAVHLWHFEPKGSSTQVITEESLDGWLPTFIRLLDPRLLQTCCAGFLNFSHYLLNVL